MELEASPRFPETAWSMVVSAGRQTSEQSVHALEKLCSIYWYPVYAYLRGKGNDAEAARDLTQEFFTRLVEKNYVASAHHDRGRFRSFLLMAVQRFLLNEADRNLAVKRGGGAPINSLDSNSAEERYRHEPSTNTTPETLYERRWALMVLERAKNRLKSRYPEDRLAIMMPFVAGEAPRGAYEPAAADLGMSEGALKVAVHRLRQHYQTSLWAEIADTVSSESEVMSEIQYLLEVLSRTEKMP
jgi:DNA-directed RNA polymerase specialized sigma24 family protein